MKSQGKERHMETNPAESNNASRREVLKRAGKAAAFITPMLLTFKLSEVKVHASGFPITPPPPWK